MEVKTDPTFDLFRFFLAAIPLQIDVPRMAVSITFQGNHWVINLVPFGWTTVTRKSLIPSVERCGKLLF